MKGRTGRILKLGITGGIGSGKTTVCKVFSVLGISVFSADDEAKRIQDNDREIQEKINDSERILIQNQHPECFKYRKQGCQ